MKIKEGDKLPNSEFFYLDKENAVKKIKSNEFFKRQKTIIIGVPGAFTKVCSAKHLPGYVQNYNEVKKKGVTKIICVSVNDPNVMKAWGEIQKVEDQILSGKKNCLLSMATGTGKTKTALAFIYRALSSGLFNKSLSLETL